MISIPQKIYHQTNSAVETPSYIIQAGPSVLVISPPYRPLDDELLYSSLAHAQSDQGGEWEPTNSCQAPSYHVALDARPAYGPIHSYRLAALVAEDLALRARLNCELLLPHEITIRLPDGTLEPSRLVSDMGPRTGVVYEVRAAKPGAPEYVVVGQDTAAALWPAKQVEELWFSHGLLSSYYELSDDDLVESDESTIDRCTLARPVGGGYALVGGIYYSRLHGGSVAARLQKESGIGCGIHGQGGFEVFPESLFEADVARHTPEVLQTFSVRTRWGRLTLEQQDEFVAGTKTRRLIRPRSIL